MPDRSPSHSSHAPHAEPEPASGSQAQQRALKLLADVVAAKPGAAPRRGQQQMVAHVAAALEERRPLLIEAPTGVGKSYGYLSAAVSHLQAPAAARAGGGDAEGGDAGGGRTVVVATATKALQEQLIETDLPALATHSAAAGHPFTYAMLKGRTNYLCRARFDELVGAQETGAGVMLSPTGAILADRDTTRRVRDWAARTETGERSEVDLPDPVWRELTVTGDECPGRSRCPLSAGCFAYAARDRASAADVVVVNTALYGAHLASGGQLLAEHDAVIFDEAHTLESTLSEAFSLSLGPGRLRHLAHAHRRIVTQPSGGPTPLPDALLEVADALELLLSTQFADRPDRPDLDELADPLQRAQALVADLVGEAESLAEHLTQAGGATAAAGASRATGLASAGAKLAADLDAFLPDEPAPGSHGPAPRDTAATTWIEQTPAGVRLRRAPVDIGPLLAQQLFPEVTVVATSATLTVSGSFGPVATRWGLHLPGPDGDIPAARTAQVDSPFDYPRQGILYVAGHLPDPRQDSFAAAMHRELAHLATAADGRTLALFTSRTGMDAAAAHLRQATSLTVLTQGERPRAALLEEFTAGPGRVLCALASFWTGVDIPGPALSLVTIDKIPFPRRDDPLTNARRTSANRNGGSGFGDIDIPAAATDLAQGVGRLIRTVEDKGAVAIFDSRLLSKSYGTRLLNSLPPLYPTRDANVVAAALRRLGPGTAPRASKGAPEGASAGTSVDA